MCGRDGESGVLGAWDAAGSLPRTALANCQSQSKCRAGPGKGMALVTRTRQAQDEDSESSSLGRGYVDERCSWSMPGQWCCQDSNVVYICTDSVVTVVHDPCP